MELPSGSEVIFSSYRRSPTDGAASSVSQASKNSKKMERASRLASELAAAISSSRFATLLTFMGGMRVKMALTRGSRRRSVVAS